MIYHWFLHVTKDRLIILLVSHWQLMISFGHVVFNQFLLTLLPLMAPTPIPPMRFPHCVCSACHMKTMVTKWNIWSSGVSHQSRLYSQGTFTPLVKDLFHSGSFVWKNTAWMKVSKRYLCHSLFHPPLWSGIQYSWSIALISWVLSTGSQKADTFVLMESEGETRALLL